MAPGDGVRLCICGVEWVAERIRVGLRCASRLEQVQRVAVRNYFVFWCACQFKQFWAVRILLILRGVDAILRSLPPCLLRGATTRQGHPTQTRSASRPASSSFVGQKGPCTGPPSSSASRVSTSTSAADCTEKCLLTDSQGSLSRTMLQSFFPLGERNPELSIGPFRGQVKSEEQSIGIYLRTAIAQKLLVWRLGFQQQWLARIRC